IREAARVGDVFVTVTGDTGVLRREHFEIMKDGAVLANSGHFDVEIDRASLAEIATGVRRIREFVDAYAMADGRRRQLAAGGAVGGAVPRGGQDAAVARPGEGGRGEPLDVRRADPGHHQDRSSLGDLGEGDLIAGSLDSELPGASSDLEVHRRSYRARGPGAL